MPRIIAMLLFCCVLQIGGVPAQERAGRDINLKILDEGMRHSQVMTTMHYLTDVYGPRLTGSPNYKAAAEWALSRWEHGGCRTATWNPGISGTRVGPTSGSPLMSSSHSRRTSPAKPWLGRRAPKGR